MKAIKATLELGQDGYAVSFDCLPTIFGFGETVEDAKEDAKAVVESYLHVLKMQNQPIPEVLQSDYALIFEFDMEALMKYIDGIVTKTALSKVAGINPIQLTHYSKGLKHPRPQQRRKIISGLHKIGSDLLAVA
jgi:predicted RNase H-like HicB family nuclease